MLVKRFYDQSEHLNRVCHTYRSAGPPSLPSKKREIAIGCVPCSETYEKNQTFWKFFVQQKSFWPDFFQDGKGFESWFQIASGNSRNLKNKTIILLKS